MGEGPYNPIGRRRASYYAQSRTGCMPSHGRCPRARGLPPAHERRGTSLARVRAATLSPDRSHHDSILANGPDLPMGTTRWVLDAKSGYPLHSFLDLAAPAPEHNGIRTARAAARMIASDSGAHYGFDGYLDMAASFRIVAPCSTPIILWRFLCRDAGSARGVGLLAGRFRCF